MIKELGTDPGDHTLTFCQKLDYHGVKTAVYKEGKEVKDRRKQLRGKKEKKIDATDHQEGLQYDPWEFAT